MRCHVHCLTHRISHYRFADVTAVSPAGSVSGILIATGNRRPSRGSPNYHPINSRSSEFFGTSSGEISAIPSNFRITSYALG